MAGPNSSCIINFEVTDRVQETFHGMTECPFTIYFFINTKLGISTLHEDFFSMNNPFLYTNPTFNRRENMCFFWSDIKGFFIISANLLVIKIINSPNLTLYFRLEPQIFNTFIP